MWCTSRASPHSTISPTIVRCLVRTRWWCTAAVSSSDGIGASTASELRSDSTITRAPASISADTSAQIARQRPLQREPAAGHPVQPLDDVRPQPGVAAVVVGVDDLGQLVVVDDRVRQGQLATALRTGREQVVLGTDGRRHRRHDLLADGVEGRVRHLGEELGEVVEQQPRAVGEHGDRGVGAHRPDRLDAVERHRGEDHLELFVGVAEELLAAEHAVVAEHHVLAWREVARTRRGPGPTTRRTAARRRGWS